MKISELFAKQGNVEVTGTIKEIEAPRIFNKFGKDLKVANAILEDESGTVKLTLWNDDVEKFKAGDVVRISNGYVGEFQGEKQLTSGKFGKIEKASGDSIQSNDSKPKSKKSEDTEDAEEEEEGEEEIEEEFF
jgi:replication factor A1